MKLKKLEIEVIPSYRTDGGKYEGQISYEGVNGTVEMKLDSKISDALLVCIGETIARFAAESAKQIQSSIHESIAQASNGAALLEEKSE